MAKRRKHSLPGIKRTDETTLELSADLVEALVMKRLCFEAGEGEPIVEILTDDHWAMAGASTTEHIWRHNKHDYPIRVRFVKKTEID